LPKQADVFKNVFPPLIHLPLLESTLYP